MSSHAHPEERAYSCRHHNAQPIDDIPLRIIANEKQHGCRCQQGIDGKQKGCRQIVYAAGYGDLDKTAHYPALILFYGQEKKGCECQDEKHIDRPDWRLMPGSQRPCYRWLIWPG